MQISDFPVTPRLFYSPLASGFVAEWEQLDQLSSTHRRVAAWELVGYSHVGSLDDLLVATGLFSATAGTGDRLLADLVGVASTDDLAARVVLHRILPSIVAIAKRRAHLLGVSRQSVFDDLISHAWITIRTYPIDRRPRRVAGSLAREVEYQTFTRQRRLRSASELPMSSEPFEERAAASAEAEPMFVVVELLRTARTAGSMPEEDLRFAIAWANGASTAELARTFDICERSVRNRRTRVAAGLRHVALAGERAGQAA